MNRDGIVRGMAYFAGSGPAAARCIECAFFMSAPTNKERGRCLMWGEFTGAALRLRQDDPNWWCYWPTLSLLSRACKYFEPGIEAIYILAEYVVQEGEMSLPNKYQAQWLRRIAHSPLMVTKQASAEKVYTLQDGTPVPQHTAETLIKKGWVIGQRDGLFDEPQSYRARSVADGR